MPGLLKQAASQHLQAFHLPLGWRFGFEVAHQADADAGHVELLTSEVAALNLSFPALADENLAVAHATPVADEEMVSHAVFHVALLAMKTIDPARGGRRCGGVMDDDMFPHAPNGNSVERVRGLRWKIGYWWLAGP